MKALSPTHQASRRARHRQARLWRRCAVASLRSALLDCVGARRRYRYVVGTEKRARGRTEKLPNKNKEPKEKTLTTEKPLDLKSPIQGWAKLAPRKRGERVHAPGDAWARLRLCPSHPLCIQHLTHH